MSAADNPDGTKPAARPGHLAKGRWLGDLPRLSPVEQRLLECVAAGQPLVIATERPTEASVGNRINADLVRFLILGGDLANPVHECGINIRGAWIVGKLDLEETSSNSCLSLINCHFVKPLNALNANLAGLYLDGSLVPGLNAQGIEVKGSVFLCGGFTANGEVSLAGAQIAGQLGCIGGSFRNCDKDGTATGQALNAQGIVVKGGVFLRDGFTAEGEVTIFGALIGGQLACSGGSFRNCDKDGNAIGDALNAQGIEVKGDVFLDTGFTAEGEVSLVGAQIFGQLACNGGSFRNGDKDGNATGHALNAQGIVVKGGVFFRPNACLGLVDFTSASVTDLSDTIASWPKQSYVLNGFRYERLHGTASVHHRIAWLKNQVPSQLGENFAPQPWEQFICVLREMGHTSDAAEVAIAKQNALRIAGKIGQRQIKDFSQKRFPGLRAGVDRVWNPVSNEMALLWHFTYGCLAGYGHKPQRIFYIMIAITILCSLAFYEGRNFGLFGPTDPLVYRFAQLEQCGTGGDRGKLHWTDPKCPMPAEYTTFQPFFYSLDVITPLVDLHQETAWAPLVVNNENKNLWGGRALRLLVWFEIVFGWMASLMLVAILGRLVDKD